MIRLPKKPLLAISTALLSAALIACGSSATEPSTSATPTPFSLTAEELLENTREAMANLNTFRFELSHSKGATLLPGGFEIQEAEGIVDAPDKISMSADTIFSSAFIKIDAIILGDITYMTNPLTRNWNILEGDESPFSVFDPPGLIADILTMLSTVELAEQPPPDEPIKLIGTLPASAMRLLVGTTDPNSTVNYEIAVDPQTFRMLWVDLKGTITIGEDPDTQRRIALSNFNQLVVIEPPASGL